MNQISCSLSPLALVQSTQSDTIAFVPVERSSWATDVSLTVAPDDPTDAPFLASLKTDSGRIVLAYQHNVALGRVKQVVHLTEKGKVRWQLSFTEELADFTPTMEPGLSGTSADELAAERARRLLLNENPAQGTKDINKIFREVLVRGQGTVVHIEKSPFPTLFSLYGSNPQRFTEVAWILAMMQLRLSATVVSVERMILTLLGATLDVDFVGRRQKKYVNLPAAVITVRGKCSLT